MAAAANPPSTSPALELTWLDHPDALGAIHAEWQALAERTKTDPFLRPAWLQIWWRHYGARRRFTCLVARRDQQLVGVMPFVLERLWFGPVPFSVARPACVDPHVMILRWPVEPEYLPAMFAEAIDHLLHQHGVLAVSFTPVSEEADHAPVLRSVAADHPRLALRDHDAGRHVVVDLPPTFEEYLQRISANRRSQFRRRRKRLVAEVGMTSDSIVPTAEQMDAFVAFHNAHWQERGYGGHYVDWPGTAEFYRELAAHTAEDGLLRVDRLHGTPGEMASQFSVVAGDTAHWRLPARMLDPEVDRLAAGNVIYLLMFEHMIQSGVTRIEAGRGDYTYKIDYGGRYVDVRRLLVLRKGRVHAVRAWLLLTASDLLHLGYYRIYFSRLIPKIRAVTGRKPRPLWRIWIRSRV